MNKIIVIVALLFCGCAGHFTVPSKKALQHPFPPVIGEVKTTLVGSGLSYDRLEKEGIAVFAVLKGGPLGLRLNTAYELFQGLRSFFPNVRVIPHRDAFQKIKEADKLPRYIDFLKEYELSRLMDLNQLRQWGKIEEVRYLFFGQVISNDKHTNTRTMMLGEDGVGGVVSVFSSGPVHIPIDVEKKVSILGELWDSKCGQAVWIGRSWAEVKEPSEIERVRVEDIFTSVIRNLIGELDQAMKIDRGTAPLPDC